MGKIRISKLGTADEQAQKEKAKVRREEKKKRLTHIAGMKGGEKLVDMSATMPETPPPSAIPEGKDTSGVAEGLLRGGRVKKALRQRSQAYLAAKKLIDHGKLYPPKEAIDLVKKVSLARFDGSVEVHINTTEKGICGQVSLLHDTGRQIRVAIADDQVFEQLSSGKIDFDILVAHPSNMPKLVKFAKLLGPKGLMPNPKAGTISEKPEELAKKFSSGATQFKSESEFPIIHFVIGKVSFPTKDLEENFQALIAAIGLTKIKSAFLKSTMSPGVKVQI